MAAEIPPPLASGAESEIPSPAAFEPLSATSNYLDAEAQNISFSAKEIPAQPYKLNISPDLFFMLLGYDNYNGLVGGGYLTASDMLGTRTSAFS